MTLHEAICHYANIVRLGAQALQKVLDCHPDMQQKAMIEQSIEEIIKRSEMLQRAAQDVRYLPI